MPKLFDKIFILLSARRVLGILGVVLFVTAIGTFFNIWKVKTLTGLGVLDFEFGHSVDSVTQILGGYGDVGLEAYRVVQNFDMVMPLAYGVFLAALLYAQFKYGKWRFVAALPLLVSILDYWENTKIAAMIESFPTLDEDVVNAANTISIFKNTVLYIVIALVIVGVYRWFVMRRN